MKGAMIEMTLEELGKKIGLPEGVAIMSCEVGLVRPTVVMISITGPGLPEIGPMGFAQVVTMVNETRFV